MDNIVSGDIIKIGGLQEELEIFKSGEQGLVNGAMGIITEIVWSLFRRDQNYDTDILSVCIDFGKDGISLMKSKSIQFSALRNYGTIE
ncbi:ATP-dependent DNA helicase [Trichonephila inaurata madagascariensis]|uniref:ATP-dependent DNA helicase n=1 Tax=Trichonephila inaurata madagascariensis TaxID=2747483 RepID=A0A8X7C4N9_9ARAC|nr:ATP-dependent DNA helicase [Trichonephila inaurata madagascariensis]